MTDDHIRRFNLTGGQPHRSFNLNAYAPPIKVKDNTHFVHPPPRVLFLPQPTLAPPGMMGSRLAADAAKWKAQRLQDGPEPPNQVKPFEPRTRRRNQYELDDLSAKRFNFYPYMGRGPEY